jgi:hypothetical protein
MFSGKSSYANPKMIKSNSKGRGLDIFLPRFVGDAVLCRSRGAENVLANASKAEVVVLGLLGSI